MESLCDVPSCHLVGRHDGPFDTVLCDRHIDRLQSDLKTFEVFPPEMFTPDVDDQIAVSESYMLWLARQK